MMKSRLKNILVGLALLVFVPLAVVPPQAQAYDSTKTDGILSYYNETYSPAVNAPEMNLESFVNETLKAILIGFPFYILDQTPIGGLVNTAVYMLANDIPLTIVGITSAAAAVGANWIVGLLEANSLVEIEALAMADSEQIHAISNLMGRLMHGPEISVRGFVADTIYRINPNSPVLAQSNTFGYNAMRTIIPFWRAFRNAAYALSAIGLVIAGFAVMFRLKIDPRMVATIENSIPKALMMIVLATFSYAIVGFMLDLGWVVTIATYHLLNAGDFFVTDWQANQVLTGLTSLNAIGFLMYKGAAAGLIGAFFGIGELVEGMFGFIATSFLGYFLALFAYLILGFIVFFGMCKIVFHLIKSYIMLLLYTIFGPVMIITGMIPGVKGFDNWFKQILSQVIVFPLTAILLMVAVGLMRAPLESTGWATEESQILMLGSVSAQNILGVGGLGIVLGLGSIIKTAQEAIKRSMRLENDMAGYGLLKQGAGAYVGYKQSEVREEMDIAKARSNIPGQVTAAGKSRKLENISQALRNLPR